MQPRDVMLKGEDYVIDIVAYPTELTPQFYEAVQALGAFLYSLQPYYGTVRVRVTNLFEGVRVCRVEFPLDDGGYAYIRGQAASAAVILACEDFVLTYLSHDPDSMQQYEAARLLLAEEIRGDGEEDEWGL
jgi:hypothetical protein